jgi:Dihaem cytochrome c
MRRFFSVILTVVCLTPAAVAAEDLERVPPVHDAMTAKECGECHMTFQPGLLPAASWVRIM